MDNNYYLEHGLKFCCESDAIVVMPLNFRDNHIKLKLPKNRTNEQLNKRKPNPKQVSVIQL